MKFSKQWLQEWLENPISTEALLAQLPMLGHEIDSVEAVAGEFSGVIVAEVIACEQHPNADRLRICQVNNGSETIAIVCGGKNVRKGLKVALATVGAVLPGDFKIKKSKIRGEESLGMLCSEVELGMAETSDGIMELAVDAPVGADVREYLALDDVSIEVDLTPNRGDCLSVQGMAREVAAKNNLGLKTIEIKQQKPDTDATFEIKIAEPKACSSYVGRVIKNINAKAESPLWLKEKLRRSGLRPKSPIVDVTNYVLLELGQPMHAFDLDKLNGSINVRFANDQETIALLNEDEITLKSNTLVIADDKQVIAIAGVMGGLDSSCTEDTKNIFLESALFTPEKMAGIARQYGLHTDSSHRFERGVDPELQVKAMERATELLLEIVGGEAGPVSVKQSEADLPKKQIIQLSEIKVEKLLGISLEKTEISKILISLHMQVKESEEGWEILPPPFRYDVTHAEDLIEEVARFYGYNNIPLHHPESPVGFLARKETERTSKDWRQCLAGLGYHEAITYSFVDPKLQQLLEPHQAGLTLANPISADMAVMRSSLWTGLLQAVKYNQHRQQPRLRLFELGKRFIQTSDELLQEEMIAGVITAADMPEQWGQPGRKVDFYDIKGHVEALIDLTGNKQSFSYEAAKHSALHPGQSSRLIYNEKEAGWLGALHPQVQQKLGLSGPVFLFEISQDALNKAVLPKFAGLSKFPSIRRDLALLVKNEVSAAELAKVAQEAAGSLLTNFTIFDVYEGKELPKGYKSIAVALILQDKGRTLVDDEVNDLMSRVIKALEEQLQARLRE
jgi:phenylalanyl-tRNA synthetase beta chain